MMTVKTILKLDNSGQIKAITSFSGQSPTTAGEVAICYMLANLLQDALRHIHEDKTTYLYGGVILQERLDKATAEMEGDFPGETFRDI
jgi:hypothetical protein